MLRSLLATSALIYRPLEARQTSTAITSRAFRRKWVKTLQAKGIPEPQLAVKYIVEHLTRNAPGSHVSASADDLIIRAESMLMQRCHRVPVQYIIGEWDFRNVTLKMRAPVLVPRPETEQLVDHVIRSCGNGEQLRFVDVGCGSGAIAISLLTECPKLRGVAIDKSAKAVSLTKDNAEMNKVLERLHVIQASVSDTSVTDLGGLLFDILVSNPPYIPSHSIQGLDPEVLWFEDHLALDGGYDGLRVTAQVLEAAQSIVKKGGHIWLELAADQDLRRLIELNPHWEMILHQTYSDFTDKIRFHHVVNSHSSTRSITTTVSEYRYGWPPERYLPSFCGSNLEKAEDTVKVRSKWRPTAIIYLTTQAVIAEQRARKTCFHMNMAEDDVSTDTCHKCD